MKRLFLLLPLLFVFVACGTSTPATTFDSPIPTDTPTWGNPYASVTLTEYANFVCPACASFAPAIEQITKDMGNEVRFVFAHYLFSNGLHGHDEAEQIVFHNAGECADDEGKFANFYDAVFAKQEDANFQGANILAIAKEAGIESETFKQCVETKKYEEVIKSSYERGMSFGVGSTPTFFINNTPFEFNRGANAPGIIDQLENALKEAMKSN